MHWTSNRYLLYLLLIAPLFPYLLPGLRGDTVITLMVITVSLVLGWLSKEFILDRTILLLGTVLAISSILVLSSRITYNVGTTGSSITLFLRLFIPSMLFVSFGYLVPQGEKAFIHLSKWMFRIGVASTCFTLASIILGPSLFFGLYAPGGESSVWWAAYQIKRFSGVFNQPLEAGVFYSSLLMLLVFNLKKGFINSKEFAFYCAFILLGGALSLSKNFIVLGIGCAFLIYFFLSSFYKKSMMTIFFVFFASLMIIILYKHNELYIQSLIELYETKGFFYALSAGRFGEDTTLYALIETFIKNGFWYGVPMPTEKPYDNAFIEYAYNGGIFALLGFLLFFIFGFFMLFSMQGDYRILFAITLLYGVFASMGGPVLSANRANIYYILVLVMPLFAVNINGDNKIKAD